MLVVVPWVENAWALAGFIVLAGLAVGSFWAPAMAMLTDSWEAIGLAHGLGFALMNFAWAPGNVVGSAVGGGLAELAGDAAAYSIVAALCVATSWHSGLDCAGLLRRRARVGRMRRLVAFACAVVLVDTLFFAALAPLLPDFESELGLSKSEVGLLVGTYALGGILGAIPAGLLATRAGIRATVLAGLAVLAVSCVAFGLVDSYWLLVLTRLLQGVGGAFCWTGALAWLVSGTPADRRGEMIGYAMAGAIAGRSAGPRPGRRRVAVGRGPAFGGVAVLAGILAVVGAAASRARARRGATAPTAPRRGSLAAGSGWHVAPGLAGAALRPPRRAGAAPALRPRVGDVRRRGDVRRGHRRRGALHTPVRALVRPARALGPGAVRAPRRRRTHPRHPVDGQQVGLSVVIVAAGVSFATLWTPAMAMMSEGWEARGLGHGLGFALMNFAWAPGNVVGAAVGGGLAEAAGDVAAYAAAAGSASSHSPRCSDRAPADASRSRAGVDPARRTRPRRTRPGGAGTPASSAPGE